MDVAYLGLPHGAKALLDAGHKIKAGAFSRGERSCIGTSVAAEIAMVDGSVLPKKHHADVAGSAPLLVCFLWDQLLTGELLARFPLGAVGYHPSLLPKMRGPDPYFWTIWNKEPHGGVSIFCVDEGMDTGPVIAQKKVPIGPSVSGGQLAHRLDDVGLDLLVEVMSRWNSRSTAPPAVKQDNSLATEAPKPSDDLLAIRWSWSARRIVRLIRAASPDPGAFTDFAGQELIVVHAREVTDHALAQLPPGQAFVSSGRVMISTATDAIALEEVAVAGQKASGDEVVDTLLSLAPELTSLDASSPKQPR